MTDRCERMIAYRAQLMRNHPGCSISQYALVLTTRPERTPLRQPSEECSDCRRTRGFR